MTGELITYYDDATGERTGLTAASVGEWSAATAALLRSECGLGAGARVGALLPPHWQTAVILLGAWSAGMEVSFRGWATAGLAPAGDPLDATFVDSRRIGSWLDDVPAGRHQFAVLGPAPSGYRAFATAAQAHLGAAPPAWSSAAQATNAAPGGVTFGEYGAVAVEVATSRGIAPGDRVLIDATASEEPLIWLLAPLSVGASIVLCANLDRDTIADRVTAERVTRVFAAAG
jgi:uncharacterized protein (TIGR03089 family)